MSKAITKEDMALLKEAGEMFGIAPVAVELGKEALPTLSH